MKETERRVNFKLPMPVGPEGGPGPHSGAYVFVGPEGGPGPHSGAYVFVCPSSSSICALYKLKLSDQTQVAVHLTVFPIYYQDY